MSIIFVEYPVPVPHLGPPPQASGTVVLYGDDSWAASNKMVIRTSDYTAGAVQTLSSPISQHVHWVAFNLPVGTVVTLTQYTNFSQGGLPGNLSGAGATVDLIGTGSTESVSVVALGLEDDIRGFFHRAVDISQGAIELHEKVDFSGRRQLLFLAEWNQDVIVSLDKWYMNNRVHALKWGTIPETATAKLSENTDGTGAAFSNIKGWGSFKEQNLDAVNLGGRISGFSWMNVTPVKEIIDVVSVDLSRYIRNSESLHSDSSGTNRTPAEQTQTIAINKTQAETVSVEVSSTITTGTELSASYSVSGLFASWSMSITLSFSYSKTTTKTTSVTQSTDISVVQEFNIPPQSSFVAVFTQQMAVLPPNTYFQTTATRWYTDQIAGSTPDPSNNGWYKRVEKINLNLSCALAVGTTLEIESTPLDVPEPPPPPPPPPPPVEDPTPDDKAAEKAVRQYWSAYWRSYWFPYWKEAVKLPEPPKAPPPPIPNPPTGPRSKHYKKIYRSYWSSHWEEYFRKQQRQSS